MTPPPPPSRAPARPGPVAAASGAPAADVASVGIVGGGQLARMTWQAAVSLGVAVRVLAATDDDSAARVAPGTMVGSPACYDDLAGLARACDVVTFDHELVDGPVLARLEGEGHVLRPGAATLAVATDKRRQRAWMVHHGFPVPAHAPVDQAGDLLAFADAHGWPVVLKAARGGYDGRGVWVLPDRAEAATTCERLLAAGTVLLAEALVPLDLEVAVLVARRPGGQAVTYPVVETVQRDGQCNELLVPARVPAGVAAAAADVGGRVAAALGSVGVLAVEFFVSGDRVLVNEVAARPHNSGHFSIEGSVTSQFENHLRAVLDLPLGAADATAPAVATVNVLGRPEAGDPRRRLAQALADPGVRVHLYEKAPRAGRKIGHVTVLGDDLDGVAARARAAAAILAGSPPEGGP